MKEWAELEEKFRHVTDKLGKHIDEGIFETVIALNALGLPTQMSCEGHSDRALPYPWIDIHMIDVENLPASTETPEIQELRTKLQQLQIEQSKNPEVQQRSREAGKARIASQYRIYQLLESFYKNRVVSYDRMITIKMNLRIQSQGGNFAEFLSPDERLQKLREYQEEMRYFTAFLKKLYFSKGSED